MGRDFTRPFAAAEAELLYPGLLTRGCKAGMGVRRIQEWCKHHGIATDVDGGFGPGTERSLTVFQTAAGLQATGALTPDTWDALTAPLRRVMTPAAASGRSFREMIVVHADRLLREHPRESGPKDNDGVWVRTLMLGNDGDGGIWEWCAGTVCFVLALASRDTGVPVTQVLTPSFGAPELARDGQRRGRFIPRAQAAGKVHPGDVFVVPKPPKPGKAASWSHTGLVLAVEGDTFRSVEGNTNDQESPRGYALWSHSRPVVGRVDYVSTGPR